jgi:WD40 repeat protein/Tfp pilus assembly protein PilF
LTGHEKQTWLVAFSPDKKYLASTDWPGSTVIIWDLGTGKEFRRFTEYVANITAMSFSPDGRRIAFSSNDGTARVRELIGDEPATVLYGSGGTLYCGGFSADGTRLLVSGDDGSTQVWDLTAQDDALTMRWASKDSAQWLAQSADGRLFGQGMRNGDIRIWDATSPNKLAYSFSSHKGIVHSVAFSSDGSKLVSGGDDGIARVWDVREGRELRRFTGHDKQIMPVAFDPQNRFVASGDASGAIKIWNPDTAKEIASLMGEPERPVYELAFNRKGTQLASAGGTELWTWDTSTWERIDRWHYASRINCAAYAADGALACGTVDGSVYVHGALPHDAGFRLQGHNGEVVGVAFTPDGRRLVSAAFDRTVQMWDLATRQPVLSLRNSVGYATALVFDPNGRRLATRNPYAIVAWHVDPATSKDAAPQRWVDWFAGEARARRIAQQWFSCEFFSTQALRADPAHRAEYLTSRAWARYYLEEWRGSDTDLTDLFEISSPTAELMNLRGYVRVQMGRFAEAEGDQTSAIELDPKFQLAWLYRGMVRFGLKKYEDAQADLSKAIELDDKRSEAWRKRGEIRAELGKWDDASRDFAKAAELSPADLACLRAQALGQLGRGDKEAYRQACVTIFERMSSMDAPTNWNAAVWTCCLTANDACPPKDLVRLMDKAVAQLGKYNPYMTTRGAALYRAGRYEDAVKQLTDAIDAQAKSGRWQDWVFLAMVQHRLDHADKAREALKQAKSLYEQLALKTWSDQLEWRELHKEAESLIRP